MSLSQIAIRTWIVRSQIYTAALIGRAPPFVSMTTPTAMASLTVWIKVTKENAVST